MKHARIIAQLVSDAEEDANVLGLLLFGSVAQGTHREDSDVDVISVLQDCEPRSGIRNSHVDGIKGGNVFFTSDVLIHGVRTVPYLLHPLTEARILFDREGSLQPFVEALRRYFGNHPEIVAEWEAHYARFREEKAQFGYEKTNIVDVWNALEKHHSGGTMKRLFFRVFPKPS